jgi:twinkle protein
MTSRVTTSKRCPKCAANGGDTSGDNLKVYDDGHAYCFACNFYVKGNQPTMVEETSSVFATESFRQGTIKELPHRRITEDTAKHYGYATGINNSEIENFYGPDGKIQAQHIRYDGKKFAWIGNTDNLPLFGQHLFSAGGKRLLITEGAIDCLTMSQVFGNKYPVVSIPNGVSSAVRAIKDNYEFVSSFETIVLCFDMDDPGQKAVRDVAEILPAGKVKIMSLPRKDPNEMLVHAEQTALVQAYWNAKGYSPDSILHVSEIVGSENTEKNLDVFEYPWDSLTTFMIGQDKRRLNLWTSATGHGKSTIIRELVSDHLNAGRAVGGVFLEESPEQTVDDLISLKIGKPVSKIKAQRILNELRSKKGKSLIDEVNDTLTEEEYNTAKAEISSKPLYLYDHIGNANINNIINRLEYMAMGLDCQVIFLDHITLLGNMLLSSGSDFGNDERLVLDSVMKKLREIIERTNVTIHVIAHIKKTDKNVDEGDRISLSDLRGSGSLGQISDNVFALERNAQHPDPLIRNTTNLRCLKNRRGGRRGIASALWYNEQTSKLVEVPFTITPENEVLYRHELVM